MKKIALIIVMALAMPMTASATPGAVNKQGCHSKPKHCHAASQISSGRKGFRYVPFGEG